MINSEFSWYQEKELSEAQHDDNITWFDTMLSARFLNTSIPSATAFLARSAPSKFVTIARSSNKVSFKAHHVFPASSSAFIY